VLLAAVAVAAVGVGSAVVALELAEAVGREYADVLKDVQEPRRLGAPGQALRRFTTTIPAGQLIAAGTGQHGLQVAGQTVLADEWGQPARFALLARDGVVVAAIRRAGAQTELIAVDRAAGLVRDLAMSAIRGALQETAIQQGFTVREQVTGDPDRLYLGQQRLTDQDQRVVVQAQWTAEGLAMRVQAGAHAADGRASAPDIHPFLARLGVPHVQDAAPQPTPPPPPTGAGAAGTAVALQAPAGARPRSTSRPRGGVA
jgi:hypothetical protein